MQQTPVSSVLALTAAWGRIVALHADGVALQLDCKSGAAKLELAALFSPWNMVLFGFPITPIAHDFREFFLHAWSTKQNLFAKPFHRWV